MDVTSTNSHLGIHLVCIIGSWAIFGTKSDSKLSKATFDLQKSRGASSLEGVDRGAERLRGLRGSVPLSPCFGASRHRFSRCGALSLSLVILGRVRLAKETASVQASRKRSLGAEAGYEPSRVVQRPTDED
jgi:hypothetical protein